MKLILIRPRYQSHIITPPLGLGYLASYLERQGIEVVIIDALKERIDNSGVLKRVLQEKPDAVGINCLTAYYEEAVDLSRLLKNNGLRCIIGGVHPTFLPFSTLSDSGADFVICGEGELALSELLRNRFDHRGIKGVYTIQDLKSDSDTIPRGDIVEDLDSLPFPDWAQIRPDTYPLAPHGAIIKNFPAAPVMATRGCPYNCTFCASPKFYGRRVRSRSVANVIEELKLLVNTYHVKEIHFEDNNLTLNKEFITELCRQIIASGLKFDWACPNGIRADKVDEPLIRLMAASGCYYFAFGIESANPKILKNINKEENIETIKKAIDWADKAGMSCQGFFIFGLPGETAETIEETIKFARDSRLSRAQFMILDVLPGSSLWDTLKGKFKPNWRKNSYKEPEWIPETLTADQLKKAQARAFRVFYFRPVIFLKLIKLIKWRQLAYLFKRLNEYRILKG
ncbi:MAG: hypothetical protein A2021_05705 [Elusimicrobia bacterium GWF2_52_66]|nr:MAG: hypothetical protein A2X33_10805 [Elusimicrobia bacterium GWA2_51_34]OGR85834.1 MAG: hypothetical protein A2021_05705 [Elusimicrobia bacterium GWF2_52_66]HAF94694.1 hypothetical protein [Elusimicrobiota bacterium]HBE04211.1 hypothetical protein [Spirochaetia bacterium]HCE98436.1 hypothetical protein [Elusimicrobiota bacterium]